MLVQSCSRILCVRAYRVLRYLSPVKNDRYLESVDCRWKYNFTDAVQKFNNALDLPIQAGDVYFHQLTLQPALPS